MKVIHVVSGLRAGGAEHIILELCKQSIIDPDVEMQVVSLSCINDLEHKFRNAGIALYMPTSSVSFSAIRRWTLALNAVRYVYRQKANIIHAHMFYACIAACAVKCINTKQQIIFTLHNTYQPDWSKRLLLFLTKPFREVDTIFPHTTTPYYLKKNAVPIPNGIDPSRFKHEKKFEIFTCLFAGRLEEQKNPLFLVDLAASLSGKYHFKVVVAGDGPLMQKLKDKILASGLSDRFELRGFVNDIDQLFGKCHCLLLPSIWEGMPLVILEAAFAQLPIITTPAGNVSSILGNTSAYIGNIQDFGKLLTHVMENYNEAIAKGKQLKQQIASYSITNTFNAFKQLYTRMNMPF